MAAPRAPERRPGEPPSRLDFDLDPAAPACAAVAIILRALEGRLRANLAGTLAGRDPEFLHDLRVAARRTRAALKQLRAALPADEVARFQEDFSRLGAATGPARDADVFLLHFPEYRDALPHVVRADLAPLHELLRTRRAACHAALARELRSDWFAGFLADWSAFLERLSEPRDAAGAGVRPIQELASARIWKRYKRVWRESRAVSIHTPGTQLHELRKRGKELRYLMEFFRSVYPGRRAGKLIKATKALQETLGAHQDLEVQIASLRRTSRELVEARKASPDALLAMGACVERLERKRGRVRELLRASLSRYASRENRALAAELFRPPRSRRQR